MACYEGPQWQVAFLVMVVVASLLMLVLAYFHYEAQRASFALSFHRLLLKAIRRLFSEGANSWRQVWFVPVEETIALLVLAGNWVVFNVLHDSCAWWPITNTLTSILFLIAIAHFHSNGRKTNLLRLLFFITLARAIWSVIWAGGVDDYSYAFINNVLYMCMVVSVVSYSIINMLTLHAER